ncbi:PQQ-dependent sugar dehydrogenase [Pedosphaera parvula]|nr:PQQ-dependent sugar dehydrogenase [Pedosphaera parvula]
MPIARHLFFVWLLIALLGDWFHSVQAQEPAKAKRAVQSPSMQKHDHAGQLFRRAPMQESSRSIIIPLATNLHLAFDPELMRTHTVWTGNGLNLYGPPYNGSAERYICEPGGPVLWRNAPVLSWSAITNAPGQPGVPPGANFIGIDTRKGMVSLLYEARLNGNRVRIEESPFQASLNGTQVVVRQFELGPCPETLFYLAHAQSEKCSESRFANLVLIETPTNRLVTLWKSNARLRWLPQTKEVNYDSVLVQESATRVHETPYRTNRICGTEARVVLQIPPHDEILRFQIVTAVFTTNSWPKIEQQFVEGALKTELKPAIQPRQPFETGGDGSMPGRFDGDRFYRVEHFPLPREINLMVTGMDWLSDGDLAVSTWTGDVYIVKKPQGNLQAVRYHRFASGLNEPLGLKVIQDKIYVTEKAQLTRLTDTDGDGEADLFENISSDWGYTGNYHAFVFGPEIDRFGNLYVYITGNHGVYDAPYQGWCVKISDDGSRLEPFCSGLRSPNGFGTYGPDGDLFMTDNEGNWIGACKLNHLQRGRFYGYPSTTPAPRWQFENPTNFAPPAVWIPMSLAKSSSGICTIADDQFGPFKGQMLVGDFQNSIVTRVMLEKVNGEWQGAVWPFCKGFLSGVNRLSYGKDGKLYVGGCKGGHWSGAVGPRNYSLDRVSFTGNLPFEIQEAHAKPDGFELVFTKPVDPASAGNTTNYEVTQFTFQYHQKYGSPQIDQQGKEKSATRIKLTNAKVSDDHLRVRLVLEGLKSGYVTSINALDVMSADNDELWHDTLFYTLNSFPHN